jgi:HlyD family secretion protein
MSALKFEIALDELDVNQVQVGQAVEVSVEALDGKTFTGKITNISVAGTTSNGATTYPVTVQIDNPPADLLPGMNVNASIITGEAPDAIVIPLEAVQRGNLVYVKGDGSKSTNKTQETELGKSSNNEGKMPTKDAPEGFRAVQVKTGLSDDTIIEITSGLSEGDIIYVPQVTHESSTSSNQMMPGGGMGGMPEGGAGGMSGGPNGASAGGGMP